MVGVKILERHLMASTDPKWPAMAHKPRAIVVHTTGRGLTRQVEARLATDARERPHRSAMAARAWYGRSGHPYFGHYLIGWEGSAVELAPPDVRVMHAGSLSARYRLSRGTDWMRYGAPKGEWVEHGRDPFVVYDWWINRWPSMANPLEFVTGRHPNASSLAIDLLPTSTGAYTPQQLSALVALVAQLAARFEIPVQRSRILGHSDIDPARRGTVMNSSGRIIGRGWDPGRGVDLDAVALEAALLVNL